jgi:hypothetical protein
MSQTVIGVFDQRDEARRTEQDLIQAGFRPQDIHTIAQGPEYTKEEGFWDSLKRIFTGGESYSEAARRGGTVLAVDTTDERVQRAVDIMQKHSPIDIDQRAAQWGTSGAQASTTLKQPATQPSRQNVQEERQVIPVVQEQLHVGKQREERRGAVRIITRVEEKPVQEQVTLRDERTVVERRPADRPAGDKDVQEKVIEVRETHERPVVSKEARVVEEWSSARRRRSAPRPCAERFGRRAWMSRG